MLLEKRTQFHGKGLTILTHKQAIQRLPIERTLIKPGNTSKSLLSEIC